MKLKVLLGLLVLGPLAFAQGQWSFHTSAEETILFGDQRSSLNFANINNAAANSGMRAGLYRSILDDLAFEATFGVVGASRPNSWSTKFVPVEIIGHYNILPFFMKVPKEGSKFNADLGIGSALVRAQSSSYNTAGRFSFSENLSFGASIDLNIIPGGTLTFGYRHTLFADDFLDVSVGGTSNDQLGRFFTAVRVPLGKNNNSDTPSPVDINVSSELSEAALVSALKDAKSKSIAFANQMNETNRILSDSLKYLQTELERLSISTSDLKENNYPKKTQEFAVIVASYKNRSSARTHADELGEDARVIEAKQIERFRVAFGVYPSLGKANEVRQNLQDDGISSWVLNL